MSIRNTRTSPHNTPKSNLIANVRTRSLFLLTQVLNIFIVSTDTKNRMLGYQADPHKSYSKKMNPRVNEFVKMEGSLFYFCIFESPQRSKGLY